jgi:Circadian oscillating protein COP23
MSSERLNITLGVIGAVVGVAGLAWAVYTQRPPIINTPVGKNDRFYCAERPDMETGEQVWTVIYRHRTKGDQPWLKMVSALGPDWLPVERCEEIARKLDIYRADGLVKLSYKLDNRTQQYIICAITKLNLEGCSLVITLKPGSETDAYEALREMVSALNKDVGGVYQGSEGKSSQPTFSISSPIFDLNPYLSDDDKK